MSVQHVCWIAVVPVTLMAMHFIVRQQAVASEPAESRKPNVVIILITITEMTLVTTSTDVSQLASVCTVTERGIKKGPSRIRTGDGGFAIRSHDSTTIDQLNELGQQPAGGVPTVVPTGSESHFTSLIGDPDFAQLAAAWSTLSAGIRTGILGIVKAATTMSAPPISVPRGAGRRCDTKSRSGKRPVTGGSRKSKKPKGRRR
jgi:hypothetical protein